MYIIDKLNLVCIFELYAFAFAFDLDISFKHQNIKLNSFLNILFTILQVVDLKLSLYTRRKKLVHKKWIYTYLAIVKFS